MQAGSPTLKTIRLQVVGYSCLVDVQFLGHPKSKLASLVQQWLRNLILDIQLWSKPIAPISIHCDSVATLAKAYSQMYNVKSRHLGVRNCVIRKLIMNGVVSIELVRSQWNLADHLTKGLPRDLVLKSVEGMS
nr:zinc finger, CCHC-type [Tanacetum cinerariifolium]